jgi:hypothetical protein
VSLPSFCLPRPRLPSRRIAALNRHQGDAGVLRVSSSLRAQLFTLTCGTFARKLYLYESSVTAGTRRLANRSIRDDSDHVKVLRGICMCMCPPKQGRARAPVPARRSHNRLD